MLLAWPAGAGRERCRACGRVRREDLFPAANMRIVTHLDQVIHCDKVKGVRLPTDATVATVRLTAIRSEPRLFLKPIDTERRELSDLAIDIECFRVNRTQRPAARCFIATVRASSCRATWSFGAAFTTCSRVPMASSKRPSPRARERYRHGMRLVTRA